MTIALAQSASGVGGFSASITQAYGSNVVSGSSLWIGCWYSDNVGAASCTDSLNAVAYNVVGAAIHDTVNNLYFEQFYLDASAAGANTVTISWSGNSPNDAAIVIAEIGGTSGFDTAPSNGGQIVTSPGTGTDAVSSGSGTPSVQPGFLIALGINAGGVTAPTPSAGTGFADNGSIWNGGGGDVARLETLRYTSLSARAATFTAPTGNGTLTYGALAAFFKETGAGGSTFLPRGPLPLPIMVSVCS